MTDFSGVSGRAEFYTYLVFAVVVGPGLAVLAFCFSSFYEFNMPHYFLNMAPFELACAVFYTVWSNWAWNRQKSAAQVANRASGSPSE